MSQRAIRRITGVGTPRAKRLAELAGWTEPTDDGSDDSPPAAPQVRGQLQLVTEPGETTPDSSPVTASETDDDTTTNRDLETSTSR